MIIALRAGHDSTSTKLDGGSSSALYKACQAPSTAQFQPNPIRSIEIKLLKSWRSEWGQLGKIEIRVKKSIARSRPESPQTAVPTLERNQRRCMAEPRVFAQVFVKKTCTSLSLGQDTATLVSL